MSVITEHFLLSNKTGRRLYFDYARKLPIIDYHNHLDPRAIVENRQFENLTQLWLDGDHYKWRAMRANGIEEVYISGQANDIEKFRHWAKTVPYTLRNPLFHWTQMELKFPFGIDQFLNPDTADAIWKQTQDQLKEPNFHVHGLLDQYKVEVVCTTDDPTDELDYRKAHTGKTRLLPTFRPDAAYTLSSMRSFRAWVEKLGQVNGRLPETYPDFLEALDQRHAYFHEHGCRLADHGLTHFPRLRPGALNLHDLFRRLRTGEHVDSAEKEQFTAHVLLELARMNKKRGWAQQFHIGPIRNTNTRLKRELGADAGCDSIGDGNHAEALAAFLDLLDQQNALAPTIVYNSNPRDNAVFSTLMGNFNDASRPGKMQHGAAWWFLDQRDGIRAHLNSISNYGLLAHFVGMLTDSRSFLSFSRHDYFRRILCDLLGEEMEAGLLPNDEKWIGQMVEDICYSNAMRYFGF